MSCDLEGILKNIKIWIKKPKIPNDQTANESQLINLNLQENDHIAEIDEIFKNSDSKNQINDQSNMNSGSIPFSVG